MEFFGGNCHIPDDSDVSEANLPRFFIQIHIEYLQVVILVTPLDCRGVGRNEEDLLQVHQNHQLVRMAVVTERLHFLLKKRRKKNYLNMR